MKLDSRWDFWILLTLVAFVNLAKIWMKFVQCMQTVVLVWIANFMTFELCFKIGKNLCLCNQVWRDLLSYPGGFRKTAGWFSWFSTHSFSVLCNMLLQIPSFWLWSIIYYSLDSLHHYGSPLKVHHGPPDWVKSSKCSEYFCHTNVGSFFQECQSPCMLLIPHLSPLSQKSIRPLLGEGRDHL